MATVIKPKRSETALSIPAASALQAGELAMNVTDGKFYTKTSGGTVKELGGAGSVSLQDVVTNGATSNTDILLDHSCTDLFDQNGYHLTEVERAYANISDYDINLRRQDWVIHKPWMKWDKHMRAHFNHCELFERKAFSGDAVKQLIKYSGINPMLWKVINMQPKWGIDVSIDYVDRSGRVFEVFHYEWDDFSFR